MQSHLAMLDQAQKIMPNPTIDQRMDFRESLGINEEQTMI